MTSYIGHCETTKPEQEDPCRVDVDTDPGTDIPYLAY